MDRLESLPKMIYHYTQITHLSAHFNKELTLNAYLPDTYRKTIVVKGPVCVV